MGVSLDGWLQGVPHPTKEDFAAAFPLTEPDWGALAEPRADAIQAVWVCGGAAMHAGMGSRRA
jgi:hypothetical protein